MYCGEPACERYCENGFSVLFFQPYTVYRQRSGYVLSGVRVVVGNLVDGREGTHCA